MRSALFGTVLNSASYMPTSWLKKWYLPLSFLCSWLHYKTLHDAAMKVTTWGFGAKKVPNGLAHHYVTQTLFILAWYATSLIFIENILLFFTPPPPLFLILYYFVNDLIVPFFKKKFFYIRDPIREVFKGKKKTSSEICSPLCLQTLFWLVRQNF